MAQATFFDDLQQDAYSARPFKPLWAMDMDDKENEKDILKWLNGELDYLQMESEDRIKLMQRNLALYKGVQYQTQETRTEVRDRGDDRGKGLKKIVANHLFDLTKNRVSRLIKYKPAVSILPTNDEQQDKVAARVTKYLLDHIWYTERFEGQVSVEVVNNTMIQGEGYLFIDWNPQKGDLDESYKEAKKNADKKGKRIPLLSESGVQEKDAAGNPIWITRPVKTGDVEYRVHLASEVFYPKKHRWSDVDYLFERNIMPVEELRVKYPDSAKDIKPALDAQIYDYQSMQLKPVRNEVSVYTLWHRRCEMLPEGRKIVFTKDAILFNKESPFTHEDLPCIRLTDVDCPGENTGYSFYETVKGLTGAYNNLTNMILRNQYLASHPKWMVPTGAARVQDFSNDITVVQFKGPQAPVLVQSNPTPGEIFAFRDKIKEEFQQISGVFGVSRGEPPPGIKAGVALQFLSEQEQERFNELVLKWNEFIRRVAVMTIAVAGDYYESDDQRMVRVLGKNNEWMTLFFDAAYLSKDYDIRVQNSSALPQSRAARMQTLLDLSQQYPNEMPGKQVLDLLDLGQSEKFIDSVTVSVRSAEAENEKLMDAAKYEEVTAPSKFEDHIQHWRIHVRQIQEYSFKYQTKTDVQARMEDHVLAHEMFMYEKAKLNPIYLQALSALEQFPIFFVPEQPEPAPAPPEQMQAALPGGPMQPEAGFPIQETGPTGSEPPPSMEAQTAMEAGAPGPGGPLQPTGAI